MFQSRFMSNPRAKLSSISIRSISYKKDLPQTASLSTRTPIVISTARDQFLPTTMNYNNCNNMYSSSRVFHFGQTLPYFPATSKHSDQQQFNKTGVDFGFGNTIVPGYEEVEEADGVRKTWVQLMEDKRKKKADKVENLDFTFKLPVIVKDFEEDGCTVHFMQSFVHGVELVEKMLLNAKQQLSELKSSKEQLQQEIKVMKDNHLKEMSAIEREAKIKAQQFRNKLKADFIKKQNHNYFLAKELALLQRDKTQLLNNLKNQQNKEEQLEKKLQGVAVYDLQIQDNIARDIINQQLRNSSFKVA